MAEPPSPLTDLLREGRYADFVREADARGLLRHPPSELPRLIAELHAKLKAERHPPGPTIEWLLIDRLVRQDMLESRIRGEL